MSETNKEQSLFNACVTKLERAGHKTKEAVGYCLKKVQKKKTSAKLGNLSVETERENQGWFILVIFLIIVGIFTYFKFFN